MTPRSRPRRRPRSRRPLFTRPALEILEDRTLLSGLTVGPNVNITRLTGSQAEGTIAVNPKDPLQLFATWVPSGSSTWARYSNDGGLTWTNTNTGGVPAACCDGQAAWDSFGNLFVTYLGSGGVIVARSTNGGATLTDPRTVSSTGDQPSIAVGPGPSEGTGSVWVSFERGGQIVAAGAPVNGLGSVGAFTTPQTAPGTSGGSFGGTAIGPGGQVMVTSHQVSPSSGPNNWIRVNLDPDGLGPAGFNNFVQPATSNVGGWEAVPAHPSRHIGPEPNLTWDRSGGPYHGRVYLNYIDEPINESDDTVVLLRWSDDNGATWSNPVRVDDDPAGRSQFMPAIALDQTTGHVAITWYDARNSPTNVTIQMFGTVSFDGGQTWCPNVPISTGTSNATVSAVGSFNFGDYDTMDFHGGVFYRIWTDNSNSTGDNPGGTLGTADMYTARVTVGNSLRGFKYHDVNGNGERDTGEPGVAGWTILLDLDDDGIIEHTATTAADGGYAFIAVPLGTHRLSEVPQDGWEQTAPADGSYLVTVSNAQEQISGLDFGNRLVNPASASGFVFHDLNADGLRQKDEPALTGWTAFADADNDGVLDPNEVSAVTDGAGVYVLNGLAPGNYTIRQVLPPGWVQSFPEGAAGYAISLSAGDRAVDFIFGSFRPATVSGTVFQDFNGNGVRGPGEPGLPGWTVFVDANKNGVLDVTTVTLDGDDYPLGTTLNGVLLPRARLSYLGSSTDSVRAFNNLLGPGGPGGPRIIGANDASFGPEFYEGGGYELRIDFTVPVTSVSIDAISRAAGRAGRLKIYNAAGVLLATFTTNTLGVGQLQTMTLTRPQGDIAYALASSTSFSVGVMLDNLRFVTTGEPTVVTGADGSFTLTDLRPGSYVIGQVLPAGWETTAPPGGFHALTLISGQAVTGIDFGNRTNAIAGTVYRDTNGDGVRGASDPGLAGWTVYLDLNNNGVADANEPRQLTDAAGSYVFNSLAAATYVVRVVVQGGWQQTAPASGLHSATIVDAKTVVSGLDFGHFQRGTAGGVVFQDLNGNGVRDEGEPGLGGWTVYADLNNNGVYDLTGFSTEVVLEPDDYPTGTVLTTIIPQVRLSYLASSGGLVQVANNPLGPTAAGGPRIFGTNDSIYAPEFFQGGNYELRMDFTTPVSTVSIDAISPANGRVGRLRIYNAAGVLLATFTTSSLTQGQRVTMTLSRPTADIAYALASSDNFFTGILLDNLRFGTTGEPSTITAADGSYTLSGLGIGDNRIRQVVQAGWQPTTPAGGFHTVTIATSGQAVTGILFGNRSGAVAGTVYRDTNGNNVRDAGEAGLAGWTVFVDLNNNGVLDTNEPRRLTDAAGAYVFNGLTPGTYFLRQVLQAGWQRPVDPPNLAHIVTVPSTLAVITGIDFGNFQFGTASGVLFQDTNGNGVRDPGEPVLPGRTVFVDLDNNGVLDQATAVFEPDQFAPGAVLNNAFPGVNLSFLGNSTNSVVALATPAGTAGGARVFGSVGGGIYSPEFYNDPGGSTWWLRINFATPVSSLSIDAIDSPNYANQRGLLRIYNAAGQLLDSFLTGVLGPGQSATMTLTRPVADIAYAFASSNEVDDGILLDNLRFVTFGEPAVVTAADGSYTLGGLRLGDNVVRQLLPDGWEQTAPADEAHFVSVGTSGQAVTGMDFGSRPVPPDNTESALGRALADSSYFLYERDDPFRDPFGRTFDGDDSPGDSRVEAFFRVFGDNDGDDLDAALFVAALEPTTNEARYLDLDGDGLLDVTDWVAPVL